MIRTKYRAEKNTVDGIKFDSKLEADYYIYLRDRWIKHELQPKYVLQEGLKDYEWNSIRAIHYVWDFAYDDIVVDIKGFPTSDAKIKRKLFLKKYPELKLKWLVRYKGEWVDYFANEKRKKENKKLLKSK